MQVNPPRHLRAITIGLLLAAVACSSENKPNYNIPDQPDGLTILPANATVEAGYQPLALTLELRQNGSVTFVPASSATWASDAPTVATVDKSGALTGVAQGTANITATYAVPGGTSYTAKRAIAVTPPVTTVELSFSDESSGTFLVDSANPQTVSAVAIYADHTARDVTADTSFTVQPLAPATAATATISGNVLSTTTTATAPETKTQLVASYHGRAFVTPVSTVAGTATPTGDLADLKFIATAPAEDFDPAALTVSVPVQTKFKVYSQADYTNSAPSNNDKTGSLAGVTYDTSDATVVTVSGNTVTAVGAGTAKITAEYVEGSIKKTASPITVTVTASKLTGLLITTAAGSDGKPTATAPLAGIVFATDTVPAAGSFKMPLDAQYKVKAVGLYDDGKYRDISRTVAWKLANANAADDKAGVVHADLTPGSSATIGTLTPPANDPAQYTPGDVAVTATFTQADGTKVKAALPVSVADLAGVFTVANDSGAMSVTATYAGSGLGTNTVTYDASGVCVYETSNEATVQVDNGANLGTVLAVPPSGGTATITAWFLPTEDSAANHFTARVPANVGSAPVTAP